MPTQRRYPAHVLANPGGWRCDACSPCSVDALSYALQTEDNLCAWHSVTYGDFVMQLGGYGFNIPAGSTITEIRMNIKGVVSSAIVGTYVDFRVSHPVYGTTTTGAPRIAGAVCTDSYYPPATPINQPWTVADLNNENFTTRIAAGSSSLTVDKGYVDACYLEVDYTPPAPPALRSPIGDGFTWIQVFDLAKKLGVRVPRILYRYRERKRERERVYTP